MTSAQEGSAILTRDKLRRLESSEVHPYLFNLSKQLGFLSEILTQDEDEFVVPYISVLRNTLGCLDLKHRLIGNSQLDFSLTIDTNDSGFPSYKDFYLLRKDKEIALPELDKMPEKEKLIEYLRDAILRGDSPEEYQNTLRRQEFYKNVLETDLLLDYHISKPVRGGSENGRRDYVLEWSCVERMTNLPVFYRMWLRQDSEYKSLEEESDSSLETILYASSAGLDNIRTLISCVDQSIMPLHPKLLHKYVLGPFYNRLTENTPELEEAFNGMEDAFALKFRIERVASVGTRKKSENLFMRLLKKEFEKEYYGPVDDSDCRMIVPARIKQKLARGMNEFGKPCKVYGITTRGDIV